jgi:hypothetical protein
MTKPDDPKESTAKSESPKKSPRKSSPKKKPQAKPDYYTVSSSLELLLPSSLGNATGDCTVLVQIDPEDSATLDFEGSTGAVGRFQVDDQGIILDLKGSQYQGTILPGPTAMVATLQYGTNHQQQLRLESITDEFCPLIKTQDLMAALEGQVEGTLDDSYKIQEEDVNILARREEQKLEQAKKQQAKGKGKGKTTTATTSTPKATGGPKRKSSAAGSSAKTKASAGGSNKKVRVSMGKKK